MDFPLESIHPKALKAHEASNCAKDQEKYWEMHDKIFEDTRAISPDDLVKNAEAVGLDAAAFKECLDGGKYTAEIRDDISQGQKAGMRGTPSFFIGLTDPKDTTKIKATKFIRGAQAFSGFKPAIDELLSAKQ